MEQYWGEKYKGGGDIEAPEENGPSTSAQADSRASSSSTIAISDSDADAQPSTSAGLLCFCVFCLFVVLFSSYFSFVGLFCLFFFDLPFFFVYWEFFVFLSKVQEGAQVRGRGCLAGSHRIAGRRRPMIFVLAIP